MKILGREDFMNLPKGTIYAKGKEWYFEGTYVKLDTIKGYEGENIDWFYYDPNTSNSPHMFGTYEEALRTKESFDAGVESRDGLFDVDDLFMVWEEQDKLNFKECL